MIYFDWKAFSPKQLQVLTWWSKNSPVNSYDGIIADGAVRSGKTIAMSPSFVIWAMTSFNRRNFALCGKTQGSLRRNVILTLKMQLLSIGYKIEEHRTENLIVISDGNTTNYFYTFGGKDEASQDLIQGMTLAGVMFDEVALMPQSFVAQAEARCSVEGSKLWYNCNPKQPTHYFKTEYIDIAEKKRLLYLHFTMDDNLTLSDEVKERYRRMFTGVFYERNVLGLWVSAEGRIYFNLDKSNIIPLSGWYEKDESGKYTNTIRNRIMLCTIGVDFGGNMSSTAFTLSGFTRDFKETVVIKERRIKEEITPDDLNKLFIEFVKECLAEYPMTRECYCDSAEQVLIRGLKNAVINAHLPVAVKNAKKGQIIDRIRFGMTMLTQHRFYFVSTCRETIAAYNDALWDSKHEDVRLDDGTTNIDSIDATEYSQEPFMKTMIDLTQYRRQ